MVFFVFWRLVLVGSKFLRVEIMRFFFFIVFRVRKKVRYKFLINIYWIDEREKN